MLWSRKNLHASVHPALLTQAEEAAQQEHISLDELVSDAMEGRQRDRRQNLRAYGEAQARKIGVTSEDDVDRVIHEFRDEERAAPTHERWPASVSLPSA